MCIYYICFMYILVAHPEILFPEAQICKAIGVYGSSSPEFSPKLST